jgi:hypothetical protein
MVRLGRCLYRLRDALSGKKCGHGFWSQRLWATSLLLCLMNEAENNCEDRKPHQVHSQAFQSPPQRQRGRSPFRQHTQISKAVIAKPQITYRIT